MNKPTETSILLVVVLTDDPAKTIITLEIRATYNKYHIAIASQLLLTWAAL